MHALGTAEAVGPLRVVSFFLCGFPGPPKAAHAICLLQTHRLAVQDGLTDMFASRGTWSAGTTCGAFTCLFLSLLIYLISRHPPPFYFLFPFFLSPPLPLVLSWLLSFIPFSSFLIPPISLHFQCNASALSSFRSHRRRSPGLHVRP